jgi:hypothetical protein
LGNVEFPELNFVGNMLWLHIQNRVKSLNFRRCYWNANTSLEILKVDAKRKQSNNYSSRHKIACLKVTTKSCNFATRRAAPRRVKTAKSSHSNKRCIVDLEPGGKGGGFFRGLEACNFMTATTGLLENKQLPAIATKANSNVAKIGTSDTTVLFNSQTLTSAPSRR